jgi:hypothetical protein
VNTIADALSCIDIDILKIQEQEALKILSQSENSSINNQINNPNTYCLDLQRRNKSQGNKIKRKGLSPTSLLNTKY